MATIAIVGNPNVGKTTLFNALTGLSHVTANYPGVTVDRKLGEVTLNGAPAYLVDLPGTYSLAARSPDEMIVVDVLLDQQEGERHIDAVLAVVDAANVERNLYLVSQLREFHKPIVIALNMCDLADLRQIAIDVDQLSRTVGVPVVPVCAHRRVGLDDLRAALKDVLAPAARSELPTGPTFPPELVAEVDALHEELNHERERIGRSVPWIEAFRALVDRNGYAEKRLCSYLGPGLRRRLEEGRCRVVPSGSLSAVETRSRYNWARHVVAAGVKNPHKRVVTISDRFDDLLTHRVFGALVFVVVMTAVFQAIFAGADPFMDAIDGLFVRVGDFVGAWLPEGVLRSLVVDGLVAGVGGVLTFIPQILILTLFIALLEDCGYMARAAYLMDKLLSRCGLSGQSFIPLLSCFACAIPGILATRVIGNRRDRYATMMVAPLMSCSARLPVYTIMIAAFVPNRPVLGGLLGIQGLTLLGMYLIGVITAIPIAWILKKTLLRGETPPFLLELPTYKWPQPATVLRKVYDQGMEFVVRAGTLIVAVTVVTWALAYFPRSEGVAEEYEAQRRAVEERLPEGEERTEALTALHLAESAAYVKNSYIGMMGRAVEPVVRPLGWDWRIGMAVIASFPAREVVIATLGTIFSLGDEVDEGSEGLRQALRHAAWPDGRPLFGLPVALSVMVFFALCCQCAATLVIIRRETRTWRWPVFTFSYMTVLAYLGALAAYQFALWAGLGAS